jgi:hypothetical protein
MSRITCRTPSTGKALRLSLKNVSDTLTTLAEAPDFSVPDASEKFADRDPVDNSRAIRPGEIFFLTPMSARNKGSVTGTVEIFLITEDDIVIELGKLEIPPGDTGFIPLQGRSIFKRNPSSANGDRLQIRANIANTFDVWTAAEEKLSSEHSGVENV